MDADQLHQLVLASLNGAERNAIVVPQLDVVVHTAEDLLRAVCEGTENDTDILEALLQALRVLRNACASGRAAVLRLQAAGAIPMLQTAVDAVGCGAATLNWQFPALLAQLLANACAGNPEFAAPAWSCLFPAHITKLAHVRSGGTQPALSLALLSCALTVPGAAAQLSGPRGSATLTALLCGQQHQLQSDQGTPNDNLGLLLTQLCFQQQFLLPLFLSLCQNEDMGGPPTSLPSSHHLTASQAFLLQELSVEAQRAPNLATTAEPAPPDSNQAHAAMQFLCTLVQHLAAESKLAPLDEGGRQVLQDALQLLAGIAGRDDGGAALTGGTSLMAGFHKEGGLPGLLAMLLALGPVRNPRRRDEAESAEWPFVAVALREQAQRFAGEPPYRGYRSDILAGGCGIQCSGSVSVRACLLAGWQLPQGAFSAGREQAFETRPAHIAKTLSNAPPCMRVFPPCSHCQRRTRSIRLPGRCCFDGRG